MPWRPTTEGSCYFSHEPPSLCSLWASRRGMGWGPIPEGAFLLMVSNNFISLHIFSGFQLVLLKCKEISHVWSGQSSMPSSADHTLWAEFNTISKQNVYLYFCPNEGPRKTELSASSSGRDPSMLKPRAAKSTQATLGESRRKQGL